MSGYTKHEYERFLIETKHNLNQYVQEASFVLPEDFDEQDIIDSIRQYYPFEWRIIQERYIEYKKADKKLDRLGKKIRYKMENPIKILLNLESVKSMLSQEYKKEYHQKYDSFTRKEKAENFIRERKQKNAKRQNRIDKALERMQRVEPEFLDKLIGLYDRKNTSQMDKVYIMVELEKYYCDKVIFFFKKVAHAEINFQLREEAVRHLLSLGHYAKLRKQKYMQIHVKNKKRRNLIKTQYAKERFSIKSIPEELEYRIENSKDQKLKGYDYFISHSSKDYSAVQMLITNLNRSGKNVYCDWIADSDYLKRHLVCDATLSVIKKRIEQSKEIIFVASNASYNSKWVKYELNFAHEHGKAIVVISIKNICDNILDLEKLEDQWYLDTNYTDLFVTGFI